MVDDLFSLDVDINPACGGSTVTLQECGCSRVHWSIASTQYLICGVLMQIGHTKPFVTGL